MNSRLCVLLLRLVVVLMLVAAPLQPGASVGEYDVKAAYLCQFARFVEWPGEDAERGGPLRICILGKSPFGTALSSIAGKTVRGRPVVVTLARRVEEAEGCHVLFICNSQKGRLSHVLAAVAGRPVLTVGEMEGFVSEGGIIGFVSADQRVRFEINHGAARRCNLRISAQLLRLATQVTE